MNIKSLLLILALLPLSYSRVTMTTTTELTVETMKQLLCEQSLFLVNEVEAQVQNEVDSQLGPLNDKLGQIEAEYEDLKRQFKDLMDKLAAPSFNLQTNYTSIGPTPRPLGTLSTPKKCSKA